MTVLMRGTQLAPSCHVQSCSPCSRLRFDQPAQVRLQQRRRGSHRASARAAASGASSSGSSGSDRRHSGNLQPSLPTVVKVGAACAAAVAVQAVAPAFQGAAGVATSGPAVYSVACDMAHRALSIGKRASHVQGLAVAAAALAVAAAAVAAAGSATSWASRLHGQRRKQTKNRRRR